MMFLWLLVSGCAQPEEGEQVPISDDEFRRPPAGWVFAPTVPRSPQRPRHKPPGVCRIVEGPIDPVESCTEQLEARRAEVAAGGPCGKLISVWSCFGERHSKRLVQMRLQKNADLDKALVHLAALRYRQNAWLADANLRDAVRDAVGEGNEGDQLAIDVDLQAAFSLALSRVPPEARTDELIEWWATSAAQVSKAMDSSIGDQVRSQRPDLAADIERMVGIALKDAPETVRSAAGQR